jgi:hypothetical protein
MVGSFVAGENGISQLIHEIAILTPHPAEVVSLVGRFDRA